MNSKTKSFIEEVELLVSQYGLSYTDAIVLYCENKSIEVESVASIIRNNEYLKSRIKSEAENLNLLVKM